MRKPKSSNKFREDSFNRREASITGLVVFVFDLPCLTTYTLVFVKKICFNFFFTIR